MPTPPPPAPPPVAALVQPAPERDLTLSGVGGVSLKASVLSAQGRPWFAVLVAGTGPMDRNWSGPHLPPGRSGEAFARWLQSQGIGSLRYDKRYVGRRDPGLDVGLDAQAGDLRAALALARTLPEAKGRKLLLVAHSEGVLVSLMVAPEVDAYLGLGMPARTMAKTMVDQLSQQLPEGIRKANLGYVERVLEAIRQGQPLPDPTTEVHPGIARLAKSLMAPETLSFVRSTLDLDPWRVLSRLPVPVALAWGDRDVQNPRPAVVPAEFQGSVLDLPETNHLLRKETRTRAELDPAKARSTYGDGTPIGDLSPLSSWLKALP